MRRQALFRRCLVRLAVARDEQRHVAVATTSTANLHVPNLPHQFSMMKNFNMRTWWRKTESDGASTLENGHDEAGDEPSRGTSETHSDSYKQPITKSFINTLNIEAIKKINPEVAEVMEAHELHMRHLSHLSLERRVHDALLEANNGKSVNITKTAVMKLKVNVLREILKSTGMDDRGNKAALVQRVLKEIENDEVNEQAEQVLDSLGEGVASRKELLRISNLAAKRKSKESSSLTEKDLQANLASISSASPKSYLKVFSSPYDLAKMLVDARADDVVIIDVNGKCAFTDYMIIASARSHQLVQILAGAVLHEVKQRCKEVAPGVYPVIEGGDVSSPDWLVVDAGSIVVHVFHEDSRDEYNLEGLWGTEENIMRVAMPASTSSSMKLNTIQ
jgi:ribosome silencing factor RsfS/YbeB/iojap